MLVFLFAYFFIIYIIGSANRYNLSRSSTMLIVWTVCVALICGLRDMLGGYDSYIYGEIFDSTTDQMSNGVPLNALSAFEFNPTEPGYGVFNVLVGYITANRYIFLFIISIFTFTCMYYHITRYCKYPAVAFFILFCMFYFFTFTYLRQVMAASIAWFAIPYAVDRKPVKFFLIVALAATFHNSAALFGLLYFVANIRFTKNQVLILIALSLIVGFTPVGSVLFKVLGGAMNEEKASGALAHVNSGRIEYIVEAIFFLVLIYSRYNDIARDKLSVCMLNIAFLFMFVLTFFVKFTDGGRMSWYFLIGIAGTVSQIIAKSSNPVNKWGILFAISLFYFRVLMGWGGILMPYKTFLTDGVRPNDSTWDRYEYDHNYDKDKLYRPVFKFMKKD